MKRFVTTYTGEDGHLCGSHVDALDFEHAQQLCDKRGESENVEGTLYLQIKGLSHLTIDNLNEMTRALAEGYDQEAPDASEFDE